MIIYKGRAYAKNDTQFIHTLFEPVNGHTARGFYRRFANGVIKLYCQRWIWLETINEGDL